MSINDSGTHADDDFTMEKLYEAMNLFFPVLYYGFDEHTKRGYFYLCKETDYNPEYIVCHPDDFDVLEKVISQRRRLVHIKDESQEDVLKRILERLKPVYPKPDENVFRNLQYLKPINPYYTNSS